MSSIAGITATTVRDGPPGHDEDRQELSRFLRAARARVKPSDIGLPASPRRRAKGLLREEVALVAGLSATWYTWLEQGRPINPSPQILRGLARALRLNDAERAHLFRLARPDLRPPEGGAAGGGLSPALAAVLHGLAPYPAYAFDALWDVVAWNAPADRLLGAFDSPGRFGRNILGRLFLDPGWRRLFPDWEVIARSAVGQFRAATARLHADPERKALVAGLRRASGAFAELWDRQEVEVPPAWRKTLDHPAAGRLVFDYATLRPDGAEGELRFSIYTPASAETAARLAALLAPG